MNLPPRLVALSPGDLQPPVLDAFLPRVEAALEGGLRGILFREPLLDDRAWGRAFAHLRALAVQGAGAWLAAHDRVHLAVAGGADAVHLGFRSLPCDRVREIVPDGMAIGLSTHAQEDPGTWAGASYLFHGPVHATPSKEGWQEPIGFEGLARAVRATDRPVLGLGGLRPGDGVAVRSAGAHGLAVRSGILGAEDPAAAARRYLEVLARVEGAQEG